MSGGVRIVPLPGNIERKSTSDPGARVGRFACMAARGRRPSPL